MPIDYLSRARAGLKLFTRLKNAIGCAKACIRIIYLAREKAASNLNQNGSLAAASTRIPHANWLLAEQSFHPVE